jgi:endoglucanase
MPISLRFRAVRWVSAWIVLWLCAGFAPPAAARSLKAAGLPDCVSAIDRRPPGALAAGVLARGVNMTDALRSGTAIALVERDIRAARKLGFRHIRLPVSPSAVLSWHASGVPDASRDRLDAVVCLAVRADMAVVIDAHPEDDLALKATANPGVVGRLAKMWDRLAGRYASVPPNLMIFEVLNEPGLADAESWARVQQTLFEHIRAAAPRHTILLTAAPGSTAAALESLLPVADSNVAYTFHFYSPMVFTHQGAEWASPDESSIRGLAYPAIAANVAQVARDAAEIFQADLARYPTDYADPSVIRNEIGLAAQWGKRNHVPLVVTEFGAYDAIVSPASRAAWLHDVRAALEANGIGWTIWEYRGGFGIDRGLVLPCTAPNALRRSLGLCSQPSRRP